MPAKNPKASLKPLRIEAEYYVRHLLLAQAEKYPDSREQLVNLALLGLRAVVDRGDGGQIYFEDGKEYPE